MTPEQKAREAIDQRLIQSGWILQDMRQLNPMAAPGVAVREFPTSTGPVDYALFIDGIPIGVVEAKADEKGENITTAEAQSSRYARSTFKWVKADYRIRFAYEATGKLTRFTDYKEAHQAVKRAQATLDDARRNEDFMRFQLDELQAAGLRPGLQDELEQESGVLGHAEEIKTVLYDVESTLGDVGQVADRLKSVVRQLEGIASIYPAVKATVERLESCHIEVADIMREVGAEAEAMDFDPRRLEQVNSALDKIYTLEQKHKVATVDELLVPGGEVGRHRWRR